MGISFDYAALLVKAKKDNVSFDKILTIGHQNLYLSQGQLKELAKLRGIEIDPSQFKYGSYADTFFEAFLGVKSVTSVDYSDYEGSDMIHDMNVPIPPSHHEGYDAVIDGGTIEHIYNFPVAIANCMHLVKNKGSLFISTTCNNQVGHGFYQFSPELFFRIFQRSNGFEMVDIILIEHPFPDPELSPKSTCYSVVDPAAAKTRICLVTPYPISIMVHAVRTDVKPLFVEFPIQSDYAAIYDEHANAAPHRSRSLKSLARSVAIKLPLPVKNYLIGKRQLWQYTLSNKQFYTRWWPF